MNMKCIGLSIAVATCVVSMPAQADQLDSIIESKMLRCATFAEQPPFSSPDLKTREMVGFDVDLCKAIAAELGVNVEIKPVSTEARIPEVKLGRVDIIVANLAYTLSRAEQIQFSDPYYLAQEMLIVPQDDPGQTKADFEGQRLASAKGSTSEQAIKLNKSNPLTFQDIASAYLAVQQGKARGFVSNAMTTTLLVDESKGHAKPMRTIAEAMLIQPIGVGMQQGQPELTRKINEVLVKLDQAGEIDRIWDNWLGPDTQYKMTRTDKVVPLSELTFDPIP